jgi:diguanylate cyclase (GGDEF)-like protein
MGNMIINFKKTTIPGYQINNPEQFRSYIVHLFRLVGTPVLAVYTVKDFLDTNWDEGIFTLAILIAFFISTRADIYHENSKFIYRAGMGLLVANFIYLIATNSNTYVLSMWMYLIPIPVAFLFGVREGLVWIILSGSSALLALVFSPHHIPLPPEFIFRFSSTYLVLGLLSLTTEYVRSNTQKLYLSKQKELLALNESISGRVLVDNLTGGYNRGFLTELFPGLIKLAGDTKTPFSIILCDIDQFKDINDIYGHVHGDNILQTVAQIFQNNLRSGTDHLVRYGGDEFLIALRQTKLEDAARLAERLRKKIAEQDFPEIDLAVTCSFGVSELKTSDFENGENEAATQFVARADKCLYKAKHKGKNQVIAQCKEGPA